MSVTSILNHLDHLRYKATLGLILNQRSWKEIDDLNMGHAFT